MAKVLIVFSSISGNTEMVAKKVFEILKDFGHQVTFKRVDVMDSQEIMLDYDLRILASPTYNQGTLEDHFKPFIKEFRKMNLKDKSFAVIGLGDIKYYPEYLTEAAKILEDEIKNAGASLIIPSLRIGSNPIKLIDKLVPKWVEKVSALLKI